MFLIIGFGDALEGYELKEFALGSNTQLKFMIQKDIN
jgi:hypothetical protein